MGWWIIGLPIAWDSKLRMMGYDCLISIINSGKTPLHPWHNSYEMYIYYLLLCLPYKIKASFIINNKPVIICDMAILHMCMTKTIVGYVVEASAGTLGKMFLAVFGRNGVTASLSGAP